MNQIYNNSRRCVFIHLLGIDDVKFFRKLVNLISDKSNGFDVSQHLFVTPFERVYNELKDCGNIELIKSEKKVLTADIVNDCAQRCEWLFVHHMCKPLEVLKIKKKNRKKILWRTWGDDAGYPYSKCLSIKSFFKLIINLVTRCVYQDFYAVGIANGVDIIDIKKKIGTMKMYRMPYAEKNTYNILTKIACEKMQDENSKPLRMVIGHSGYRNDNHISIINKLKLYKDENIEIYFPLSYGDKQYIENVKTYAKKVFGNKVCFLEKFMPYEEFARFLNSMDIAILAGKNSYALGNIALLIFFGKKLYINPKGVIAKAFMNKNVSFGSVCDLGKVTFEEISRPIVYNEDAIREFAPKPYDISVNRWKKIINDLEAKD